MTADPLSRSPVGSSEETGPCLIMALASGNYDIRRQQNDDKTLRRIISNFYNHPSKGYLVMNEILYKKDNGPGKPFLLSYRDVCDLTSKAREKRIPEYWKVTGGQT